MTTYLVAGCIFPGRQGEERFTLVCPSSEELPYVFEDGVMSYFKLIWQHAHLYRVEDDYTLALTAFSPEAIHWGVKAPERVTPDTDLLEKLRAVLQPCQTGLKPNGTKIIKSIKLRSLLRLVTYQPAGSSTESIPSNSSWSES